MTAIDGMTVRPLRRISDERGAVLHMLRNDAEHFESFGEIYFSTVNPGAIKGWHRHHEMVLNYAVPVGQIKLVCYDDRPGSPSHGALAEVFLGEQDYALVTIPAMVWNGFKGVSATPALVANCATIPHRPDEIDRMDPFTEVIPYDWAIRHG